MPKSPKNKNDYIELGRQCGLRLFDLEIPTKTIGKVRWKCEEQHLFSRSYWQIQQGRTCGVCNHAKKVKNQTLPFVPLDTLFKCKDCLEELPLLEFPHKKERKYTTKNWIATGKRKTAICKMCWEVRYNHSRIKYQNKPEIKAKRRAALATVKKNIKNCKVCATKMKPNRFHACQRCYIRQWIYNTFRKTQQANWYKELSPEKQFVVVQNYRFIYTTSKLADIANMPGAKHYPRVSLFQKVRPQMDYKQAFHIDNLMWKLTLLDQQQPQQRVAEVKGLQECRILSEVGHH